MWETSSTESIYKYFIFKPINGDLKYIEQMLKKYGLELYDRYGKGGDSIYVNLTDNEWGTNPPKSFWYTFIDNNNEAARVDKDSSIEWALNVIKSVLEKKELVFKDNNTLGKLPPLQKANLEKELDDWIDMLTGDKENETYPEDFNERTLNEASKKYLDNTVNSHPKEMSSEYQFKYNRLRSHPGEDNLVFENSPNLEGKKESDGKLEYELDWEFISMMAERMAVNKSKYGKDNWKKPIDIDSLKQSLFRHVIEIMKDNYQDGEEDLGHITAASLNCMMLNYQLKNKK